ncbi:MAG TPA: SGNH hydrolase domain-containing protein [Solirubrobacteraceae bacterium]|nr:SGNH hydrolase domain-containing protein [Solirubrobacteraceae bacterium]
MRLARLAPLLVLALLLSAAPAAAQTAAPEDGGEQAEQPSFPRCFGAASRDPLQPCRNPRLARMVRPKPFDALLEPNSPCTFLEKEGELSPCAFGVPQEQASETIALIGDSHAAHWRAALDHVMAAKRWYGISMTKAGCPLSTAVSDLPQPLERECIRWKRQLFEWFGRHPEVTTVITSNHTGGKVVGAKGRDYQAHVEGYTQALAQLPPTVQRIFSIRDVPRNTRNSMDCVAEAIRRRRNAGPACAVPRRYALKRDPAKPAARRSDPRRVQFIDMTHFMCSSRLCLPVIGGALVHKDQTHLTRVFATTLGPYLLRYVDRGLEHMAAGTRP